MKIIDVNLVDDIIFTQYASLHTVERLNQFLRDRMSVWQQEVPAILIMDMMKANPLDHYLCESFGKLQELEESTNNLFVVYKAAMGHRDELLLGILDANGISYSEDSDGPIEDHYRKKNLSIKLLNQEFEGIEYISSLTKEAEKVLNYIHEEKTTDVKSIVEAFETELSYEKAVPILKELSEKRLCFMKENGASSKYLSLFHLIPT